MRLDYRRNSGQIKATFAAQSVIDQAHQESLGDGLRAEYRSLLPNRLRCASGVCVSELSVSQAGMKSFSLHRDDREVATYTADANQSLLADGAMQRLVEGENWLIESEGIDNYGEKTLEK